MNLKITTAADLRLATAIFQALPKPEPKAPSHPFADESPDWGELPKKSAKDLFS
jgi:2-C-methyl-D-erythritol 4-phosphate cytidylyltransferase